MKAGWLVVLGLGLGFGAAAAEAQSAGDGLKAGFETPPNSARPRVWWHWVSGNVSKEGIKLDLEWMQRSGLGGFENFEVDLRTPLVMPRQVLFDTPEWRDDFLYATKLARGMGFEEGIGSSPGWNESGGPWVTPAHAMKKYVWSETAVEGGQPFSGVLAQPPAVAGPFQDIARPDAQEYVPGGFYRDSVVVAFRRRGEDTGSSAELTANDGRNVVAVPPRRAIVNDAPFKLPLASPGVKAWMQYEYARPQTIRSMMFATGSMDRENGVMRELEASDDGAAWRPVAEIPWTPAGATIAFAPVTARFFRVTFVQDAKQKDALKFTQIGMLRLFEETRVNRLEMKAGFQITKDVYGLATPEEGAAGAIAKQDVVDLTGKMTRDGRLDWTPPPGHWTVLRMGYSLEGYTNRPSAPQVTGLEVDKLNGGEVKEYINTWLDKYQSFLGPLLGTQVKYVTNDSYEVGAQNWTEAMLAEFKQRRGYDATPWLPVLTGRIVESARASDAFLWDFRKTLEDLMAQEHYGVLETELKRRGLKHYVESHEAGRAIIADGMEVKKRADIPMGAYWTQRPGVNNDLFGYDADDKETASVAHIYGQNLAAAESMTAGDHGSAWAWSPATLKPTADKEMAEGINRFIIHSSVHQPKVGVGSAPGLGLAEYGQWFNRNETWADEARPWVDYLARSSYLLQQGKFVADVLYFYGEDSNVTAIFSNKLPDVPLSYAFDYVNADALMHEFDVQGGRITTKTGMSYRVLGLDAYTRNMSLGVLKTIEALVRKGAVVAGPKPVADVSLVGSAAEFRRIADELFGDGTGVHSVGAGKVFAGASVADALHALNVLPDFEHSLPEKQVLFVHRRTSDAEVYWVDNRSDAAMKLDATFRVAGKVPEVWIPETGETRAVTYTIADGRTTVPLALDEWGAEFIVFFNAAKSAQHTEPPAVTETVLATLDGPWPIAFEAGRGAPASGTPATLESWSESANAGVKYFSGKATYTKWVGAPASWLGKGRVWIDLGEVKNLAEVKVNGVSLGVVWHAPFRVDATKALKLGQNKLEITVTNAWVNRLIGDQQPGATQYTFTTYKPYTASSPLQASGLLGPVRLLRLGRE